MNGILLPAIIENISTRRDGTIKVTIGTNELSQGKAGELFALNGKIAAVYISPKETISQKEMDQITQIDPEVEKKTQSQRLRAVLFRLWEQKPEGFGDFESFYKNRMNALIEQIKSKLQ